MIENKPISHANFRLAHLLTERKLATLIVTPNFDDFLSKALTLFGQAHIVCDHPNTVERIDPESSEIQIVHVHGTYWFYDCCNLRGEIEERTADSRERAVTMTSLLGNILSRRSALVIGYAGWENDVIMTALERRLKSGLPNNLYWFCFRRSDIDALRAWLKKQPHHRDVCLVLPPERSKPATGPQPTPNSKLTASGEDVEPTLPGQKVLDKLVAAFTREAPWVTRDPIGFFAGQLTKSFPQDSSDKLGEDIYDLLNVIRTVEHIRQIVEAKPEADAQIAQIELVRDAVRRSAYQEALARAATLARQPMSPEQRETLIGSVFSAATGLSDNSQAELDGYDLVVQLASGPAAERSLVREYVAMAVGNKGVGLRQINRTEEAVQTYDQMLQRFGDASEPVLRKHVAVALRNQGFALGSLGRKEEAIQTYDNLLQRFGDASEPALREQVAVVLFNKGVVLGQLNREEEAIKSYDQLVQRFGDASEPVLREQVAKTLLNKGIILGRLNRSEEEIKSYDQLVQRFGDASEPVLREQVAGAFFNKGITLGQLDRGEEAIRTYDQLLERFSNASEPALRQQVAKAFLNKGVRLGRLGRTEEEIQNYDQLLQRFGDAPEPALREQVAKAFLYKGVTLGELDRREEEIQAYDQVLQRFGDAPEPYLREQVAIALRSKGITLRQLDRSEEAIQVYDQLLQRFSDAPEPALLEQVAKALLNKGAALKALGRVGEAIRAFQDLLQRLGGVEAGTLKSYVENAQSELRSLANSPKSAA